MPLSFERSQLGIFPGGLVSRVVADAMCYRDAMWYIMTGDPFDGKKPRK